VSGGHDAPYTFDWSGPDGFTSSAEDLIGLNSGDYVLTVSDAENCMTQITIHVGQNDQFTVTGIETPATCFGECDGAIDITTEPAGVYTFSWTGPNGFTNNNSDISNLCAGTYTVTVATDDCEDSYIFEVTQPEEIQIETAVINPLCFGQNNGSIDVVVNNGSGDYTYEWAANANCSPPFAGSSNQNIGNLFACDYTLLVTDNVSGCTATTTVRVYCNNNSFFRCSSSNVHRG